MISFCQPCLQWKFLLAYKAHPGFNGFLPPFQNKYLNAHVRQTIGFGWDGTTFQAGSSTLTADWSYDRFTALRTQTAGFPNLFPGFIYGSDVSGPGNLVRDDFYSNLTTFSSGQTNIVEYTLSNPYTQAMLDADIDALLNAVNPDTLSPFKLYSTAYDFNVDKPDTPITAVLEDHLPAAALYLPSGVNAFAPWDVPELRAGSWYLYLPDGEPDAPNHYLKLLGFLQLAGDYCAKTFYVDASANPIGSPTCLSGHGVCGSHFKVNPPPFVPGQNAYTLIVPNCQCQG
jgi:hypothetical protein